MHSDKQFSIWNCRSFLFFTFQHLNVFQIDNAVFFNLVKIILGVDMEGKWVASENSILF